MRVSLSGADSGSLLGYRAPLLSGDMGTAQTVRIMRRLIDQALNDPQFVRFAVDLVRNVPAHDEMGEVSAIFRWVQQNIRYTKDPVTKEKLYPPQELLNIRAGDCDDMAMLLGALVIACGYPARLVTVGADPGQPDEFSHVYLEVEAPPGSGNWLALDAARPDSSFGRQPETYFRKRAWSLIDDSFQDLSGCTRLSGLSGYARLQGMGDDGSSFDWNSLLSQTLAQTPQIIAAAQGLPTGYRTAQGAVVSTGSPYGSFMTPYTPGALTAGYGYSLPQASSTVFSTLLPWLLIGGVLLAVVRR
jgi:Transglutaminase-like superfamily